MRVALGLGIAIVTMARAQPLLPARAFTLPSSPIAIRQAAEPSKPFTVAGSRGGIFGEQDGGFEAWSFPVKLISHFRITAELADYPVTIDVNAQSAEIEVDPDHTTITYSHAAFTIRQHMFATPDAGVVVLFQISSIRPMELTFRFTPEMLRMWPAANSGPPNAEWVAQGDSGFYILHTDDESFSGGVAIPTAKPGILPPYQEKPKTYPTELKLAFDPKKDDGLYFPLLLTHGASRDIGKRLAALNDQIPQAYAATRDYYARFFERRLTAETPDSQFDAALRWAEVAIDQGRVRFHDETGLIAGWYSSGDSARPGYGWFFGRDTLFTLYAINAYGDFDLTRTALEFLFARQRADGKIMHEFSQTADLVDWKKTPYFYASADSTPLLVMTMEDYVNTSGDTGFLQKHWDQVKRAYAFTRAHDSDGDGIYDNSQGTGWVESWPPQMPHQEIYLASFDQQSSGAMSRLAAMMHDDALAKQSAEKADEIRKKLPAEYYDSASRFYAFSRNPNGSKDLTATIYPSVAWWDGTLSLPDAGPMLDRWGTAEFSTDWGTRDVSTSWASYDPISYHQGSVWPLFTGWVSLAEYRAGRTISGEEHLLQNLQLTWAQDPGACTELLSGAYYQPLGRSSSHQTWSSSLVLIPALRGLFGLAWDATHNNLRITPRLPANWSFAKLHNVPLGDDLIDVNITREGGRLHIKAQGGKAFRLNDGAASTSPEAFVDLPAVEISIDHHAPLPGAETAQIKAAGQSEHSVTFEAQGGSTQEAWLRINDPRAHISGGELHGDKLLLKFPEGAGYQKVTVSW